MAQVKAYIGLGSNLGDRRAALAEAVRRISEAPKIRVIDASSVLETKPVGPVRDQPDFLNRVVEVETELTPLELLNQVQAIENAMGRIREERGGPRTIDLDILLYGKQIIDHPRLTVPHPEIANRPFVVAGLMELGVKANPCHREAASPFGGRGDLRRLRLPRRPPEVWRTPRNDKVAKA
jgi:2-amino-4-hydroxy-6-hydroxymethyldihydropteridine diphosphokinase